MKPSAAATANDGDDDACTITPATRQRQGSSSKVLRSRNTSSSADSNYFIAAATTTTTTTSSPTQPQHDSNNNNSSSDDEPAMNKRGWPFQTWFLVMLYLPIESVCLCRRVCRSFATNLDWPPVFYHLTRRDFPCVNKISERELAARAEFLRSEGRADDDAEGANIFFNIGRAQYAYASLCCYFPFVLCDITARRSMCRLTPDLTQIRNNDGEEEGDDDGQEKEDEEGENDANKAQKAKASSASPRKFVTASYRGLNLSGSSTNAPPTNPHRIRVRPKWRLGLFEEIQSFAPAIQSLAEFNSATSKTTTTDGTTDDNNINMNRDVTRRQLIRALTCRHCNVHEVLIRKRLLFPTERLIGLVDWKLQQKLVNDEREKEQKRQQSASDADDGGAAASDKKQKNNKRKPKRHKNSRLKLERQARTPLQPIADLLYLVPAWYSTDSSNVSSQILETKLVEYSIPENKILTDDGFPVLFPVILWHLNPVAFALRYFSWTASALDYVGSIPYVGAALRFPSYIGWPMDPLNELKSWLDPVPSAYDHPHSLERVYGIVITCAVVAMASQAVMCRCRQKLKSLPAPKTETYTISRDLPVLFYAPLLLCVLSRALLVKFWPTAVFGSNSTSEAAAAGSVVAKNVSDFVMIPYLKWPFIIAAVAFNGYNFWRYGGVAAVSSNGRDVHPRSPDGSSDDDARYEDGLWSFDWNVWQRLIRQCVVASGKLFNCSSSSCTQAATSSSFSKFLHSADKATRLVWLGAACTLTAVSHFGFWTLYSHGRTMPGIFGSIFAFSFLVMKVDRYYGQQEKVVTS